MTLTKADMVEFLVNDLDVSNKDAIRYIDFIFEQIKDVLEKGNSVKISGFGNWSVREKRSRMGRNPQTGEAMEITARKVVKFKYSQVLRDIINGIPSNEISLTSSNVSQRESPLPQSSYNPFEDSE